MFWHRTEEVTGGWIESRSELFFFTEHYEDDQVKEYGIGGYVGLLREIRSTYRILVGRTEGKMRLRDRRLRWEGNIKMDFKEIRLPEYGLDLSSTA